MLTVGSRLQCFTVDYLDISEICVYDATPTEAPSVMGFGGKGSRCSATTIEAFAFAMHDYGFCKGYGPIPVGIIEDFLAEFAVERVEKYRGRSEA